MRRRRKRQRAVLLPHDDDAFRLERQIGLRLHADAHGDDQLVKTDSKLPIKMCPYTEKTTRNPRITATADTAARPQSSQ